MYKIQLDTGVFLLDKGKDTWAYAPIQSATTFDTKENAQEYMDDLEISFIVPNAHIVEV